MKRLPEYLRETLRRPLGKLYKNVDEIPLTQKGRGLLVSVGDVTTAELVRRGILPDISIVDNRVMRGPVPEEIKKFLHTTVRTIKVRNPPSTITSELMEALREKPPFRIEVEGEEDLAALACGVILPIGSLILYGQPHEGVVAVELTEEKKKEFLSIYEKFI